jgi:hypothetical protein
MAIEVLVDVVCGNDQVCPSFFRWVFGLKGNWNWAKSSGDVVVNEVGCINIHIYDSPF